MMVDCPICDGTGERVVGRTAASLHIPPEDIVGECWACHGTGIVPPFGTVMASRCAWCKAWTSEADRLRAEAGAVVTHGICESCGRNLQGGTI